MSQEDPENMCVSPEEVVTRLVLSLIRRTQDHCSDDACEDQPAVSGNRATDGTDYGLLFVTMLIGFVGVFMAFRQATKVGKANNDQHDRQPPPTPPAAPAQ